MAKIGFLGTGAMGSRMARRLLGEHSVTVYNRTRARASALVEAGARWASTPREAADGGDIVISVVTDDRAAESLWLDPERGAVTGLRAGAVAIESSTVTPGWVRRLAVAVRERDARLLDAPVVGSTPQADAGALAFLVGGDAGAIEEVRPALERMGAATLRAGGQGCGAILKLAVNALFASQVAVMGELLTMLDIQGMNVAAALELLTRLPVTSPVAAGMGRLMLAGDHAPRFPAALVAKDLRYACALAPLPVIEGVRARFEDATRRGLGEQNLTVVHALARAT